MNTSVVTFESGVGEEFGIDMAFVNASRMLSCSAMVRQKVDTAGITQTVLYQHFKAIFDPAPPDCEGVLTTPPAIRAQRDNCKGGGTASADANDGGGRLGRYQTVKIDPFLDPQGFEVSIRIDGVTTNQLTANCRSCPLPANATARAAAGDFGMRSRNATTAGREGCTCLPPAVVGGGGGDADGAGDGDGDSPAAASVCVMPDVAGGRAKDGRVFRIYFTASSPTGLTCSGVAKLCAGGASASSRRGAPGGGAAVIEAPAGTGARRAARRARRAARKAARQEKKQQPLRAGSTPPAPASAATGSPCGAVMSRTPAAAASAQLRRRQQIGVQCRARAARLLCIEDDIEYDALQVRMFERRKAAVTYRVSALPLPQPPASL